MLVQTYSLITISGLLWPVRPLRNILSQVRALYLLNQRGNCGFLLSHWIVAIFSILFACVGFLTIVVGVHLSFLCGLHRLLYFFLEQFILLSILNMFLFLVSFFFLIMSASIYSVSRFLFDKMSFFFSEECNLVGNCMGWSALLLPRSEFQFQHTLCRSSGKFLTFQRLGYIICKGGNNSTYLIGWGVSKLISVQCLEDWPAYQQILTIDTSELCF